MLVFGRCRDFLPPRLLVSLLAMLLLGCGLKTERRDLPPEVTTAVDNITADIAAERYEKVYREADELFRQDATLEESIGTFKTMREKLGTARNRLLHSAVAQENSGGKLKGRVVIVSYQTTFERGNGMETFTLIERNHQWLLARYRVTSSEFRV